MKDTLWDMLITMPPSYAPNAKAKVWPTVECPRGVPVKATQRDLRRFRALKSGLARLTATTPRPKTAESTQSESAAGFKLTAGAFPTSNEDSDESLDKIVEPLSWTALAYSGFMWWASAGEQARSDEQEEAARDAALLADLGFAPRTPSMSRPRSSGAGNNRDSIGSVASRYSVGPEDDEARTELGVIAYFHRLTSQILTVMADLVESSEDCYEDEDEDEQDADDVPLRSNSESDLRSVRVDSHAVESMGLDVWSTHDGDFVKELMAKYFERKPYIEGKGVEVCGIENAVDLAFNPTSDPSLKQQAYEYLGQFRGEPNAWQISTSLFSRNPRPSEVVRLFCLEAVNYSVHTQGLDPASLKWLKDILLEYVRNMYGQNQGEIDPPHLQNKMTQTLTYLFVILYNDGWQSFIDDFLVIASIPNNTAGVIFYLRLLGSLHDEIADMLLARNTNDAKRNTDLKDRLRANDVQKVARSWQDFLSQYSGRNDAVVSLTLMNIGKWISWMDISLIVNQQMLGLLLPVVGRTNDTGAEDLVRNSAIDTLNEIVGKKMKGPEKMELISFVKLRDIVAELIASAPLSKLQSTPQYDTDLAEIVAKLVNTTMADIVRALEDGQANEDTRTKAEQHLHAFLPFLLRFLSDEYDEVCSNVLPSLTDLLTLLRKVGNLPASYKEMLPPILNGLIMKMRYDETSNWGEEDEQTDEAEFQDLRKRLQVLQKTVAAVDQDLYIEALSNLVSQTFSTLDQQGGQMDWRDLDLALHEMYLFGELALPNQGLGTKSQPNSTAIERLTIMVTKMVESGISNFPHPAIVLQYMEICVRYWQVFDARQEYIPQVLENFVRLVHHDHVRIKTRSWYLFQRFVKFLRAQVGNVAETVIQSISDLLPIKAEVSENNGEDDYGSDESDHSADALFNSQLFLFEAIGCIASTGSTPADKQAYYARIVMSPLFSDMEAHLSKAQSGDSQAILQIHHIILALGTLAHGFSDWTPGSNSTQQRPPPDKLVSDEFARAAEAILVALRELNSSSDVRTACRASFSKLLGVLGSAVLPQLPQWIEGFLSQSSSKDEMAMFLRLLDQIVFGFKTEIYDVLNMLLTPLLQRIYGGLQEPVTGTDDEIQLGELRREYLSFLLVILNHELQAVFISETNQAYFESLITSILTLGRTLVAENIGPSRLAFSVLARMVVVWGGPDVAQISENPSPPSGSANPTIPGFDRFMIERFHPLCWEVFQDPNFKPHKDAQSKQVLNEIAGLEQAIYMKTGDLFIQNLHSQLFPHLGIDGSEFLRYMSTSTDRKAFSGYLQGLLKSRR
ncbi:Exportin-T [Colletotrichum spinosum]|uniref:Exportin-T n=1 Tax=Colletotrichum spinosum TaxID=1347390 RepID=A0A4V6QEB7_9PEZI|nr:Exportin-T [Colletotrichum spinosum]